MLIYSLEESRVNGSSGGYSFRCAEWDILEVMINVAKKVIRRKKYSDNAPETFL
jgi:hypothetical protein